MKKCGYIFGAFDRFCFLLLPCGPNLGSYNSSWLHLWKLRKTNIVLSRPNKKMFEGIHQMLSDCVYIPLMINDVFRYILLLINIVYTCIYVCIYICTYQSSKTCFLNIFFNSSDFSSTTHYPPHPHYWSPGAAGQWWSANPWNFITKPRGQMTVGISTPGEFD